MKKISIEIKETKKYLVFKVRNPIINHYSAKSTFQQIIFNFEQSGKPLFQDRLLIVSTHKEKNIWYEPVE